MYNENNSLLNVRRLHKFCIKTGSLFQIFGPRIFKLFSLSPVRQPKILKKIILFRFNQTVKYFKKKYYYVLIKLSIIFLIKILK